MTAVRQCSIADMTLSWFRLRCPARAARYIRLIDETLAKRADGNGNEGSHGRAASGGAPLLCPPPAALNPSAIPDPSPQPRRTRPSRAAGSCIHHQRRSARADWEDEASLTRARALAAASFGRPSVRCRVSASEVRLGGHLRLRTGRDWAGQLCCSAVGRLTERIGTRWRRIMQIMLVLGGMVLAQLAVRFLSAVDLTRSGARRVIAVLDQHDV